MSIEQDYFPPKGTKYKQGNKALTYSPQHREIWYQQPASIYAHVNKNKNSFIYFVQVRDFNRKIEEFTGKTNDALLACITAEKIGDEEKKLIWLPWMEESIKVEWRTPL